MDERTFENKLRAFWGELRKGCIDADRMYLYLAGDLDQTEVATIENHLTVCEICAVKKAEILEAQNLVGEVDEGLEWIPQRGHVERFFTLLTSAQEKLSRFFTEGFAFPDPVKLLALRAYAEQVAFADAGRQFEKETKTAQDVPFDVELTVFGKRWTLIAKSKSPLYSDCVVQFQLVESDQVRFTGVLIVREGQGTYETDIERLPKPEKEEFTIRVMPIHNLDLLAKVEEEASAEILAELLSDSDRQVRRAAVDLLAGIGSQRAKQILSRASDDEDPEIRRSVRQLLQKR